MHELWIAFSAEDMLKTPPEIDSGGVFQKAVLLRSSVDELRREYFLQNIADLRGT